MAKLTIANSLMNNFNFEISNLKNICPPKATINSAGKVETPNNARPKAP